MESNITRNANVDQVAARLQILLAESGMTKAAFAKSMGVSSYTAYQWFKGYRMPSDSTLYRISRKANVSIPWLLGEDPIDERGDEEFA